MQTLKDLSLQIGYGPSDDRLRDFFIPAMAASIRYDRAAGYFSSTMLAVAAAGVTKLILNGGKMRLLCGADLSEADVAAIGEGHATLAQKVEKRLIPDSSCQRATTCRTGSRPSPGWSAPDNWKSRSFCPPTSAVAPFPLRNPTAITTPRKACSRIPPANRVGFSGSVNESATALEDNYETS